MYNTKYLDNQFVMFQRGIFRIFKSQLKEVIELLESMDQKWYETKGFMQRLENLLNSFREQVPKYITDNLPKVIKRGFEETYKKYKKKLSWDYKLSFDLPTDSAVKYLSTNYALLLSDKWLLKLTKEDLTRIIGDGISAGKSYGQIAKEIEEDIPFAFSKSRAKLIAVNEVWRAYWFGYFEPVKEMKKEWFDMEKQWITSHDSKVRPDHKANESEWWISIDKKWKATGDEYAPSHNDINCRCYMTTRIVS